MIQQKFIDSWYHKRWWNYLLLPFSILFFVISRLRYFAYYYGLFKQTQWNIPIIVVGNITVGGTGKTPLVIALVEFLQRQGFKPAVVSRGYGGKYQQPTVLTAASKVSEVGDEACFIFQRTSCPVAVGKRRVAVVQLIQAKCPECNVIISDDGLQHYSMGRQVEIVVIDGQRRFGNGYLLPAGPLREPAKRLQQVDFIVSNGGLDLHETTFRVSPTGVKTDKIQCMQLISQHAYQLLQPDKIMDLSDWQNQRVHAVAGIGHPQRFFQQLREQGIQLIEHPFPDHHFFQAEDLKFDDDVPIFMTEKDAVKCQSFANLQYWVVPVSAKLSDKFYQVLLKRLPTK